MHKLAKGLKKKKKQKKGKKGEEDEFDPEELERYRRERAEAQQKAEESGEQGSNAGSDEWKKFQALTAGVDSVLKKTQGDLDRIKSTSFFQRKPPLDERPPGGEEGQEDSKKRSKKWVGFDEEGNPIEAEPPSEKGKEEKEKPLVNEDGFVEVPEDDVDREVSADEDIFDTTYVDVLENIDVQLAYIPDSPTEEELGDDPFDTTNADKVLKTVDKKGNKLVSLGNAVEVLSGRVDYVSSCKITKGRRPRLQQDLLLDDFDEPEKPATEVVGEPVEVEKTLLDDDTDLPDIPVDLTKLPPVLPRPVSPAPETEEKPAAAAAGGEKTSNGPLDISEFEVLKEKTILEEIPDLDESEFDLEAPPDEAVCLEEAEDPFAAKEPETIEFQSEIIEASFEAATFVDEEDPFDTTFAENLLPGKTELKFIEQELEELPVSEVTISLTDPAGLNRDYETGLLKLEENEVTHGALQPGKKDLLGGSTTDLSQLADEPIAPAEELTYVDPFDTSAVPEVPPGRTELKFLEEELLGDQRVPSELEDEDFDPRKDEEPVVKVITKSPPRPPAPAIVTKPVFQIEFQPAGQEETVPEVRLERRTSRPEALDLAPAKAVAFELPTPSKRPDLLATGEEEKTLPSKPLTPYYTQKSIEEVLSADEEDADVDPFDTSFVEKVAPGKTELKLIESELLKEQEAKLPHSLSDHDFDPRADGEPTRRQSDFTASSNRPNSLKLAEVQNSLLQKFTEPPAEPRRLPVRQESLLDTEVEVGAKLLTPRIEARIVEEEDISYADPFDTSIASNILPGKAELKILETELREIPGEVPVRPTNVVIASVVASAVSSAVPEIDDFDPRADERKESRDFLCSDDQEPADKVLTPLQNKEFELDEDVDPFDTSFATLGPGKTELKILESELMQK